MNIILCLEMLQFCYPITGYLALPTLLIIPMVIGFAIVLGAILYFRYGNDSLIEMEVNDIYWCTNGICENPPYRHSHKERAEMAKMKKVLSLVCFN